MESPRSCSQVRGREVRLYCVRSTVAMEEIDYLKSRNGCKVRFMEKTDRMQCNTGCIIKLVDF